MHGSTGGMESGFRTKVGSVLGAKLLYELNCHLFTYTSGVQLINFCRHSFLTGHLFKKKKNYLALSAYVYICYYKGSNKKMYPYENKDKLSITLSSTISELLYPPPSLSLSKYINKYR